MGASYGLGLSGILAWDATKEEKIAEIKKFATLGYVNQFQEVIEGTVYSFDSNFPDIVSIEENSAIAGKILEFYDKNHSGGSLSYSAWTSIDSASIVTYSPSDKFKTEFQNKFPYIPFAGADNHVLFSLYGVLFRCRDRVKRKDEEDENLPYIQQLYPYLKELNTFCKENNVNILMNIWG